MPLSNKTSAQAKQYNQNSLAQQCAQAHAALWQHLTHAST